MKHYPELISKQFLPLGTIVLLLIFLSSCSPKQEEKPPNILFIMSDDHAFQAISTYQSHLIQTPNIDRLAKEGMRFDRAFVTNSICAPSRAVILTGKHSHLNGVLDNTHVFDSTQQTFPRLMQVAGYETAVIGKWHLKSQPAGFDFWKVLPGQGDYYQPDFLTQKGKVREQGYVTDLITDFTIDWLKNKRNSDKPFMLMCQHKAPHREWITAQEYLGYGMDTPFPEPATLFDDYEGRGTAAKEAEMLISEHMGFTNDNKIPPDSMKKKGFDEFSEWYANTYNNKYNRMSEAEKIAWDSVYDPVVQEFMDSDFSEKDLLRWKYQRYMQDYLGTIRSVDDNVGRILQFLDESGLAENTIIVYTSDQGFYLGEHGWFDKRFMYEESFRTPLLVRWPDHIKVGSVSKDLVQNLDFAQTFLDVAGAGIPEDMQGQSMLPLFEGNNQGWRDAIYYHYFEYPGIHAVKRHYGVRTDRYKLIHFYNDIDEWEFYDLETDPHEMVNLINDPAYQNEIENLEVRLGELRVEYGDTEL